MTFGDFLGWAAVILLFALVLGITIRVWRNIVTGNGHSSPILLFRWLTGQEDQPLVPMLLICGDEAFCEDDEIQLNRARIWFRKLEHATLEDVEKELQRRRLDGTLYHWLHVSAHGTVDGFVLSDGILTPQWMSDRFEGIQVVFAATCDSAAVGDALDGIVDAVVVVYGKRGSGIISTFALSFWREMAKTGHVRRSFEMALREVPSLRPFVDLRLR